jgi:glycosyltransferase involved in cell wall biosynthesis
MPNKILIVSDAPGSALSIAAEGRSKQITADMIYSSEFRSPNKLITYISANRYNLVLFAWRGALKESLCVPKFRKIYQKLTKQITFHCLIPDFIGLDPKHIEKEKLLLLSVHGYWVTCKDLETLYEINFKGRGPLGILHDLPDVENILNLRSKKLDRSGIIWVGNSRWGSNHGFIDHKGFNQIISPLSAKNYRCGRFRIFDSANIRISNQNVLLEIAKSHILVQASEHEGTGLPVLEALGLGTVPVTTNVGIVKEVLVGDLLSLVVPRNISDFDSKIQELGIPGLELANSCIEAFDKYVEKISNEIIVWERMDLYFDQISGSVFDLLLIKLKWMLRYLRNNSI